ncbi:PREDICTED: LOW QUALITY PROTEIN: chaperone protein dnaJ 11, chloroplastic [Brassica oleracea var. oleracea]|uniref:LOW QUALITY PROTEIN: chaperone protein dnaJ 11, chloroplastic n=1 Tax=Brassica oleracea var. oleracea TaxID=109376 RepID=UPI0006A6FE8C|nr:PREDICTED: LOW QUALITY PROTEIN: chaperone protein dnaJ 11, chloroplastic [Brassica oleracea var. oleracea]
MMLSSSPTFFAPPLLSSSSPPFSAVPPPPRTSQISISATTASSYTCAEDPPRLRQIPQRLSASVTPSLYEILEIPVGSTSQVIKSAYRRLARICHPDVAGNRRNYASSDAFMKIHAAYCTLSDPEKRAVYDRKILCGRRPLTVGVSRFGSYGGGNWETDQCW